MTAVCITTQYSGLSMMEAMARPLNQWHRDPSGAPKPGGPYPSDFKAGPPPLDDRRVPRLSTPPNYPALRLPVPQPTNSSSLLRRDSVQSSSHASTPSPLDRSPPGPLAFADSQHLLFSAPRRTSYDLPSLSGRSSPTMLNGRADPNYVRTRQPSEASSISQYALARTPQIVALPSGQAGGYYNNNSMARAHTPRPSQSPRQQLSQGTSPAGSRVQSPRQEPRNNTNMAVHALLNDEATNTTTSSSSKAAQQQQLAPPTTRLFPPTGPLPGRHDGVEYELTLRQQPVNARSCGFGDRDRRVVDPPPIIQLKVVPSSSSSNNTSRELTRDEVRAKLRHPMNIVHCSIWSEDGAEEMSGMPDEYTRQKRLMGNLVASPFVGTDEHGEEGCFFCFPDISCRTPGKYRLKFSLISLDDRPGAKSPVKVEVLSGVFQTFSAKEFPGMSESSALAKTLKHQGCNIPTKKGNEMGGGGGGGGGGKKRDDSDDFSDEDESPRRKRPRNSIQ